MKITKKVKKKDKDKKDNFEREKKKKKDNFKTNKDPKKDAERLKKRI